MTNAGASLAEGTLPQLLRGDAAQVRAWGQSGDARQVAHWLVWILVGAGSYGAAMGWWRSPYQALFNALKFPLVIGLTTLGTGLINAMLAPLLGVNLRGRESLRLVLMSFAAASVILGAFAPLVVFVTWNTPAIGEALPRTAYSAVQLMHVAAIACAGTAANARLLGALRAGGSRAAGGRVLLAWLTCNLLLGTQLCWILRPFIGAPHLPVQFLRPNAFEGNFYEALLHSLARLLGVT